MENWGFVGRHSWVGSRGLAGWQVGGAMGRWDPLRTYLISYSTILMSMPSFYTDTDLLIAHMPCPMPVKLIIILTLLLDCYR